MKNLLFPGWASFRKFYEKELIEEPKRENVARVLPLKLLIADVLALNPLLRAVESAPSRSVSSFVATNYLPVIFFILFSKARDSFEDKD